MNQEIYYKLISVQKKGFTAVILRIFLSVISIIYSAIIHIRNFLYDFKYVKTHKVKACVISIGNITSGGTGKTPLVAWLCNLLSKNYKCAVLTRGYKVTKNSKLKTQNYKDEPAIIAQNCPECKIIINPDRVAGAREAIDEFSANVLIMDDGFQHRRISRDIDIIAIDAMRPFGYDKIFPAGLLREPVSSLKRANAVVITRCDQVDEAEIQKIEQKILNINPRLLISRSIHAVTEIIFLDGPKISIDKIKEKRVFAFCGIGNPQAFTGTIKKLGSELVGTEIFNDHHNYNQACLDDVYKQAELQKADIILTTQKDLTKITNLKSVGKQIPIAFLPIKIKFLTGREKLRSLIESKLEGTISADS